MSNSNRDDAVDELGATAQSDRASTAQNDPSTALGATALDTTARSDAPAVAAPARVASQTERILATGTQVDRYEIVSFLGAGAMGSVYRARDSELAREVALKVLDTSGLGIDAARMRLRREAQAMARVDHPAVVRIFDVGTTDAHLYVTMQLVPGGTLSSWLKERPRTWREILAAYVTAGRGLAAAHAAGIVHRDFKPANVLVDDAGAVRVTDFGLAHGDDEVSTKTVHKQRSALHVELTATGELVGTPLYMAPEQMRGEHTDARADQFAFCVALWEALYGKLPFAFSGAGFAAVDSLRASIEAGSIVAPPRDANVPRKIEHALRRGLNADPAQRWPDMTSLVDAIELRPRSLRIFVGVAAIMGLAIVALVVWRATSTRISPALPPLPVSPSPKPPPFVLGTPELIEETVPQVDAALQTQSMALRPNREIVRTRNHIVTIESLDGKRVTRLSTPPNFFESFAAGAGPALAASSDGGGQCTIWQLPIDGGPPSPLVPHYTCGPADLTEDRARVAFFDGARVVIRELGSNKETYVDDRDPTQPFLVFSPDGSKLAIQTPKSLHVVGAGGADIARIPMSATMTGWLDETHLVVAVQGTENNSELRMVSTTAPGTSSLLRELPGAVLELNATKDGLLVQTMQHSSRIYSIPMTGLAEDAALSKPIDTGSTKDGSPVAWSDAGLFVLSLVHRHQVIQRIAGPDIASVVTAEVGQRLNAQQPSSGSLLYSQRDANHCENHVLDLATGTSAPTRFGLCESQVLQCARDAPRCIIITSEIRWFDPRTQTLGDEVTDNIWAISPDGTKVVRIVDDGTSQNHMQVVTKAGHVDADFHVNPPIPAGRLEYLMWQPTGDRWLGTSSEGSKAQLFELDPAGHRRTIAWTSGHDFVRPTISPDGKSIAVAIASLTAVWSYLPIQRN